MVSIKETLVSTLQRRHTTRSSSSKAALCLSPKTSSPGVLKGHSQNFAKARTGEANVPPPLALLG